MLHRPISGKTGVHLLRSFLAAAAFLTACGHQEPFPSGEVPNSGPRSDTPPIRLTFAQGEDRDAAWLADGTTLVYSFRRETQAGTDRCLGEIPAEGGTRFLEKCVQTGSDFDSLIALGPVAPGPGLLAAWVDFRSLSGRTAPDAGGIRVGTLAPNDTGRTIRSLPYPAPSGQLHATATNLSWLGSERLAYIGADVFYVAPCKGCKQDTVAISREAVLADLQTSPATLQTIPNTSEITSLFPSADGLSIYYTRPGDTRVYRQILAGGAESIVHDFAAAGIARDVNVRGNVLTATVGGNVNYFVDPLLGARQVDSGGVLYRVDLASGDELSFPFATHLVQHPALSPDGRSVVVEAYDTLAPAPRIDLWLYRLP